MKYKFPSIRQFREVLKEYRKAGLLGKVEIIGYPKIHGANGSILFLSPTELEVHSKEQVITPTEDMYGFAQWVDEQKVTIFKLAENILAEGHVAYPFAIAGEWAGGDIQRKSSVNGLPKFFTVVAVANVREETDPGTPGPYNALQFVPFPSFNLTNSDSQIYDKRDFCEYHETLDLAFPEKLQNVLADYTVAVEATCPVALYFGVESNKGEGVVWEAGSLTDRHLFFKVKGKAHSSSKVRELARVNTEQVNSIVEFIDYACTENRMLQAAQETGGIAPDNKNSFMRWLSTDIAKEETDTLETNGLTYAMVGERIASKAITWYRYKLKELTDVQ